MVTKIDPGLSSDTIRQLSRLKHEPDWLLQLRLDAYQEFRRLPMPHNFPDLDGLDLEQLCYYHDATDADPADRWQQVPDDIKMVYQKIGLPQAEQHYLAGAQAQSDSRMVYEHLRNQWADSGIIFTDTDTAVQQYPDLVRQYFGTVVDYHGNKFAALNTAVWSGGSFIYIPPGVRLPLPLQAYFRINIANLGQFERSLIIVDHDASLQYVEGCSAPIFNTDSLHNSVVEIVVQTRARMRYTAVQNWSANVYNIVNSRMNLTDQAIGEWVDANIGSRLTRKCPAINLAGVGSRGSILSLSTAHAGQIQDTGGRAIHLAPQTSSTIISKSLANETGVCTYRGHITIDKQAVGATAASQCDSLLLDQHSVSNTFPTSSIQRSDATISHEASTGRISQEQLFYLTSRGLSHDEAINLIISGFVEPIVHELPMEYASELNRLLSLSMKGAVG